MVVNETITAITNSSLPEMINGLSSFWEFIIGFIGGIFGVYVLLLLIRVLGLFKYNRLEKKIVELKEDLKEIKSALNIKEKRKKKGRIHKIKHKIKKKLKK